MSKKDKKAKAVDLYERFKVPMIEAGKNAYLHFDTEALAQLESDLGDDYWRIMESAFNKPSSLIISRALAVALKNAEPDGAPWGLTMQQLGTRLYDAQIRVLIGVPLEEATIIIKERIAAEEARKAKTLDEEEAEGE